MVALFFSLQICPSIIPPLHLSSLSPTHLLAPSSEWCVSHRPLLFHLSLTDATESDWPITRLKQAWC